MTGSTRRSRGFDAADASVLRRTLPEAAERMVDWRDGPIRIVEAGAGPPVLFLHGVTGTLTNLAGLAAEFAPTHRVVLVDLPGHGRSGPLRLDGSTPRASLVAAVGAVADAVAPAGRVGLVGNSLGGMAALWFAVDRPDRVAALAGLGEPAYALEGARARFPLNALGVPVLGRMVLSVPPPPIPVYRRTLRRGFGERALDVVDPNVLDANRRAVWAGGHAGSVAGLMRALMGRRGRAADGIALTAAELATIEVPVWFLWGTDDPFQSPDDGRRALGPLPGAVVEEVDGGGHVPWFDTPEAARRGLHDLLARAVW